MEDIFDAETPTAPKRAITSPAVPQKEKREPVKPAKPPAPPEASAQIYMPAPRPLPIKPPITKPPLPKLEVRIAEEQQSVKKAPEQPLKQQDAMEGLRKVTPRQVQLSESIIESGEALKFFTDIGQKIIDRPQQLGWPWVKSKPILIPEAFEARWRSEGALFSSIGMLEFYHQQFALGEVTSDIYQKQLRALLGEAIKLRLKLEKEKQFNFDEFLKREKLKEYFPKGLEKLRIAEGSSDLDSLVQDGQKLNYQELVKLPTKAADYVSNGIELMDLIRLKAIATVDRLLPLLDEMHGILLQTREVFGDDYWAIKELEAWRMKLSREAPGTLLPDADLERLEMQAVRWMNDFRRELKNI